MKATKIRPSLVIVGTETNASSRGPEISVGAVHVLPPSAECKTSTSGLVAFAGPTKPKPSVA